MSSVRAVISPSRGSVIQAGHLKKLKTLKKKYFVLRGEAQGFPACLEYYDSRRKFENMQPPKRSILLRSCFNINKRSDTKHKQVIALYTKDECFCLVLESEKDLQKWLNSMLLLQNGHQFYGEQPRPTFEHIWQVTMQKKGLGERKNIHGPYRLCLTDRVLSLVKLGAKHKSESIEFPLSYIRRSGYMDRIFYMEVGRSAITGGGEFWMEAEDNNIAHNMHQAINNAMIQSNCVKEEIGPRQRMRSSSANEASKPILVMQRRHAGQKILGFSPLGAVSRDRCDSLPSRARASSESHSAFSAAFNHPRGSHTIHHVPRPHSMYGRGLSYSPPISSIPISPVSGACSTDSAGSSLSVDDTSENILDETSAARYCHSLTPEEPVIFEENGEECVLWSTNPQHKFSSNFKSHSSSQSTYAEMCSPCELSPSLNAGYMPMSPSTMVLSHSRTRPIVEDNKVLPDGYVPMAPAKDSTYIDMDTNNSNGHFLDDTSNTGESGCSVTSGTPSTDLRFSEYHLDKVTSFLSPNEVLQSRPTRAYSVGSRPDPGNTHRKNRVDLALQDGSRERAFSVGSRSMNHGYGKYTHFITNFLLSDSEVIHSKKSFSEPHLSTTWNQNQGCSATAERMQDLMELDFSKPSTCLNALCEVPVTAMNTGPYVDMSPSNTQSPNIVSHTDFSGLTKVNQNNNNTTSANHNRYILTPLVSSSSHKPITTDLECVDEIENSYMKMDETLEHCIRSRNKQTVDNDALVESSDEYMKMNRSFVKRNVGIQLSYIPDDYREMCSKNGVNLQLDYVNMERGVEYSNFNDDSPSQPINIQTVTKLTSFQNFVQKESIPAGEITTFLPSCSHGTINIGPFMRPVSLYSSHALRKPLTSIRRESLSLSQDLRAYSGSEAIALVEKELSLTSPSEIDSFTKKASEITLSSSDIESSSTATDLNTSLDHTINEVSKQLSDMAISKPLIPLPTRTPIHPSIKSEMKLTSSKIREEALHFSPTKPDSLHDNEGCDKVQPHAAFLHYASLDLPEFSGATPTALMSLQDSFNYAEIDFTKLKPSK